MARDFKKLLRSLSKEEADQLIEEALDYRAPEEIMQDREERTAIVPIDDYIEEARNLFAQWGKVQGISSRYLSLDNMTKGFVDGEMTVIGGQTSHGKTQLAMNIAYNVAKNGDPVLFVTMEMTKAQLTSRFMKIAEPQTLTGLPINYQKTHDLPHTDIYYLVKKAVEQGNKMIVVDHLHYFSRETEYSSEMIGRIVKDFKIAAVENEVPIVLISHVRKLKESQRPEIQDLRDSSFIAQDTDIVLMVWKDTSIESDALEEVEVAVLKNRQRGLFPNQRMYTLASDGAKLTESKSKLRKEPDDETTHTIPGWQD